MENYTYQNILYMYSSKFLLSGQPLTVAPVASSHIFFYINCNLKGENMASVSKILDCKWLEKSCEKNLILGERPNVCTDDSGFVNLA